jgi:hypothetical protein
MHELPDESLGDILPVAKKIALATGAENYNILNARRPRASRPAWSDGRSQNNGAPAHQVCPGTVRCARADRS